jgi:hypothetical protein
VRCGNLQHGSVELMRMFKGTRSREKFRNVAQPKGGSGGAKAAGGRVRGVAK